LPIFERPAVLQGFLLRRLLSAALRNAHLAHSGLLVLAIMQKRCFLDFSPDRGYRQYCET
jgi:hypothetical protein